jgi:D-glycero-alpha-D-manno-heptose-7-phosphate kinase
MIIARAPFRITLGGGGTDLPSFYEDHQGFIFAVAIDKYVNVLLNPTVVDRRIRLQYLQSEVVEHVSELRHPLAREALRLHGIERAIEITSVADLPARAGVGSSGSYLVAMLTALHAYKRRPVGPALLAEEACHIEMDLLKEPVGKQDQYMASFGGLRTLAIERNGAVTTAGVELPTASLYELVSNMHVYYTGVQRSASAILGVQNEAAREQQHKNHTAVMDSLLEIKELGYKSLQAVRAENFDEFGGLLHAHWEQKKRMSGGISLGAVDALYDRVRRDYGVLGGKIIGAGGGGFLMLYCPRKHSGLTEFMARQGMRRLHYSVEYQGAKIVADLRASHEVNINHKVEPCEHSLPAEPDSLVAIRSRASSVNV